MKLIYIELFPKERNNPHSFIGFSLWLIMCTWNLERKVEERMDKTDPGNSRRGISSIPRPMAPLSFITAVSENLWVWSWDAVAYTRTLSTFTWTRINVITDKWRQENLSVFILQCVYIHMWHIYVCNTCSKGVSRRRVCHVLLQR